MKDLAQSAYDLFGISLSPSQLAAFERYENELLEWNARINLTAIQQREQIRVKHFLDSLACLPLLREAGVVQLVDVGSGAGFPGLPLKIAYPSLQLCLVESVGKKAAFCQHIVDLLELPGVEVVQARAEALGRLPEHRQRYDCATARAVAVMPVLSEYLLPLVNVGGFMLAMKGESAPAEAHSAEKAIRILGGHLRRLVPVTLPGVADERYLVIVDKVAATPEGYPRHIGLPAKKPLK
jgi:16S rRNA (guanine527-N7)-methyltransferase